MNQSHVLLLAAALVGAAGPAWSSITRTSADAGATATTGSSVPSSSVIEDYDNDRKFAVYPKQPIASLTVFFRAYPAYGPDVAYCRAYLPGAPLTYFEGQTTFTFANLSKGELDRTQAFANCEFYTHEPHGPLSEEDIRPVFVEGRNSSGEIVPTRVCLLDSSRDDIPEPGDDECRDACGDAICDGGEPTVADVLAVIRSALGAYACPLRICDVNFDRQITAADGLKVLRRAVQLRSVLLCPPDPRPNLGCWYADGRDWNGPPPQ